MNQLTWQNVQLQLRAFKMLALALSVGVVLLTLYLFTISKRNVWVLERTGTEHQFNSVSIASLTEADIESFITNFIKLRYSWTTFDPKQLLQNLKPITTNAFLDQLEKQLGKQKAKKKDEKTISQYVAQIVPKLTENQAMASFDRILRIDGVPLVLPSQAKVHLIEGAKTPWNPFGLYVDALEEFSQ